MPEESARLIPVAVKTQKGLGRWKLHWIRVTPHEGLTRFIAETEKDVPTPFLVDLDGYWGLGWCGCENFGIELEPTVKNWRADERVITDEWRCKHIIACRIYLGLELTDSLLKQRRREARTIRRDA